MFGTLLKLQLSHLFSGSNITDPSGARTLLDLVNQTNTDWLDDLECDESMWNHWNDNSCFDDSQTSACKNITGEQPEGTDQTLLEQWLRASLW